VIASVIGGSPAQLAGIEAGDRVLDYADSRVFAWSDLRNATRGGARGEYVAMRIRRNGEALQLALPRGPLGVRLDSVQIDPDADR
jgi:S1-C subfamily serine protease